MKALIVSALLALSVNAQASDCKRMCNPEKSKPCGNACISKDFKCTKPTGSACVGKRVSLKLGDAESTLAALGL